MSSPTSLPQRRRRALAWGVGGLLLALVAGVGISEALGWRYLRAPAQDALMQLLGVPVRVAEPFSLHLLRPPELALGGLWVAAAPGSGAPFLLDARELRLQWRWADLWAFRRGEPLRIKGLDAAHLEAHLRRDAGRPASWSFPLREGGASTERSSSAWPQFDDLQLRAGRLHVKDEALALQVEAQFRIAEVRTSSADRQTPRVMALGTDASVDRGHAPLLVEALAAQAPEPGFEFEARGSYRQLPMRVSLSASRVLPFLAQAGAPPVTVSLRASVGHAQLAYEGTLSDLLGERDLDGAFRLSGPSLGAVGEPLGVTLPSTPPFTLRGRLLKNDPVWRVAVAQATVGASRLAGEFAYDPQPAVPMLSGRLRGSRLALADLAPAVGAPTTPVPAPGAEPPRLLPDRSFDLPSLKAMDADVQVALDELDLNTAALDPLKPLKGRLRLGAGVLRIDGLEAHTAGGSVFGSTQLDGTAAPPRWQADLRWRGVDIAGWLRGARKPEATVSSTTAPAQLKRERQAARGGTEPVTAYLTGELQGQARLTGQGHSTAQILATLDGEAQALVRDGSISHLLIELMGIDVAQSLGVWVKGDDSLPLRCAVVAVDARQGVLTSRVALLDTSDTTVLITGTVDLKNEQLDLRAVARPKDFSFVALRSPLRVQGSFAAPRVGLEGGPIATRLLASAALAVVNPLAALLPLFDRGENDDDGCRALGTRSAAAPR
jgi:uncharacterized protein involved in outer membrane biogenesis